MGLCAYCTFAGPIRIVIMRKVFRRTIPSREPKFSKIFFQRTIPSREPIFLQICSRRTIPSRGTKFLKVFSQRYIFSRRIKLSFLCVVRKDIPRREPNSHKCFPEGRFDSPFGGSNSQKGFPEGRSPLGRPNLGPWALGPLGRLGAHWQWVPTETVEC